MTKIQLIPLILGEEEEKVRGERRRRQSSR